jgi:hypothetical protein
MKGYVLTSLAGPMINLTATTSVVINSPTIEITGADALTLSSNAITTIRGDSIQTEAQTIVLNSTNFSEITSEGQISVEGVGTVTLESTGDIILTSPATDIPVPFPIEGVGGLVGECAVGPVVIEGDINFEIPNVLICENGILKTVTLVVNIVCA